MPQLVDPREGVAGLFLTRIPSLLKDQERRQNTHVEEGDHARSVYLRGKSSAQAPELFVIRSGESLGKSLGASPYFAWRMLPQVSSYFQSSLLLSAARRAAASRLGSHL